jgi:hypothetical protein
MEAAHQRLKDGCFNGAYGKHERVVLFKYSMENGHSKSRFYLSALSDEELAAQNGKGWEFEHAFELQDAKAFLKHLYDRGHKVTDKFMEQLIKYMNSPMNTFIVNALNNKQLAGAARAINIAVENEASCVDFDNVTCQPLIFEDEDGENRTEDLSYGFPKVGRCRCNASLP